MNNILFTKKKEKKANKQTKKNIYRKCSHMLTLKAYT
jgi:hypothetical protein